MFFQPGRPSPQQKMASDALTTFQAALEALPMRHLAMWFERVLDNGCDGVMPALFKLASTDTTWVPFCVAVANMLEFYGLSCIHQMSLVETKRRYVRVLAAQGWTDGAILPPTEEGV
jgi:hypothetical protein